MYLYTEEILETVVNEFLMYKACQSITVSNPIRKEETNSMNMTEISVSIINEYIGQTKN